MCTTEKPNFNPHNSILASGGLGILFVSAVPAMYRLELLSDNPTKDIGKLIALTACAGFFGVFFVIPLRKYFIVHQKLTFPTPAATVSIQISSFSLGELDPDLLFGRLIPFGLSTRGGAERLQRRRNRLLCYTRSSSCLSSRL